MHDASVVSVPKSTELTNDLERNAQSYHPRSSARRYTLVVDRTVALSTDHAQAIVTEFAVAEIERFGGSDFVRH
jgi:hypothetical protein